MNELFFREKSCFQCYQIYNRTRNIVQILKSECDQVSSLVTNQMNFDELCATINQDAEFDTLFCKLISFGISFRIFLSFKRKLIQRKNVVQRFMERIILLMNFVKVELESVIIRYLV